MKNCLKCHKNLPESKFYPQKIGEKRLRPYCKKCLCEYNKKYAYSTKEHNDRYRFGGIREKIITRDGFKCVNCGMTREEHFIEFNVDLTVDHINGMGRYSKIKDNSEENLQTLCLRCHGEKDIRRKFHKGFIVDDNGNLTVDISNPFGLNNERIVIGDEDHTEAIEVSTLSNSQDSVIL